MEKNNYTNEELDFVKNLSLTSLATDLGYSIKKVGNNYSIKEMDSIIIYNDRTWRRWSNKGEVKGGTTIDFVIAFGNINTVDKKQQVINAIKYLLDYSGNPELNYMVSKNKSIKKNKEYEEIKEFILPEKYKGSYKRLYAYLSQKRGISDNTISYFLKKELMYEDNEHHNIIFLGKDSEGNIKFATKRGTYDSNGYHYRGDVAGNNKNYGVNIFNNNSYELNVFEAVIDMMSFCDLVEIDRTNKIALSMLSDNPLKTFLQEHSQIKKINFWFDNDNPGRKAATELEGKYLALGYEVTNNIVPVGKDVNDYLLHTLDEVQRKKGR